MNASLSPVKSGYPLNGYPLLNHIRIKYHIYIYTLKKWMGSNVIYVINYIRRINPYGIVRLK